MKDFCPHNYQQYCIDRIIRDPALGLFLDMGLGKTAITLTAIKRLKYEYWAVRKVLVIAPKKVAESTWDKEAAKWSHLSCLRLVHVLGSVGQRTAALAQTADVYLINRENVQWLVGYYGHSWPFDMVVIDESSSFKNHQAKRFKALKLVRSRINRIVELTGTPNPRSLMDLWAQVYLLDCGQRLGRTITSYRDAYFVPDKRSRTTIFSTATNEVIHAAQQTVLELQQTTVEGMKKAHADGKLTKDEITELGKLLIDGAMAKMSDTSKNLLNAAGVDISAIIRGAGEALIARMK